MNDEDKIKERWSGFFQNFLHEENPMVFGDGTRKQGLTSGISRAEVKKALLKMNNGKATEAKNGKAATY